MIFPNKNIRGDPVLVRTSLPWDIISSYLLFHFLFLGGGGARGCREEASEAGGGGVGFIGNEGGACSRRRWVGTRARRVSGEGEPKKI